MKIPKNMTEKEVLDIFDKVIKKLVYKFKFGRNQISDMYQEAMVYAIEGIEKYDDIRPLENFIYTHIHNRLYNFKRNNYFRLEKPCEHCPLSAFIAPDGCSAFKDREECTLYAGWLSRNNIRKNLTNVLEYSQISTNEKTMGYSGNQIEEINSKEILELIDSQLPVSLRKTYLKMLSGERIPKKERIVVEEYIISLLKRNKYEL